MDNYTDYKVIGEGSFGTAWRVTSIQNGKYYAIKQINLLTQQERTNARQEIALLAQLNHPCIVRYYWSFEDGDNLNIVMDYCDGGDLCKKIESQKQVLFDENQIVDWFVQICLALKHIHDRKVLHRDIKPKNVFLNRSGTTIQLGDFGIAKVLDSTGELARSRVGTPYYISPEIVESRHYDNKCDVWSLGCVLYELATLAHPFDANDRDGLYKKISSGIYKPLSEEYSNDLRDLVAQLLKTDPSERPPVNTILKKEFIRARIDKFLSPDQKKEEFSHTALHGEKLAKVLPAGLAASRPPGHQGVLGNSGVLDHKTAPADDAPADIQQSKKIVRQIKQEFCSRVRPSQLLSSITFMATNDEEEIRNTQDNKSSHAACLKFLSILEKTPFRVWSSELSKGLRRLNMTSMADDIERLSHDTQ